MSRPKDILFVCLSDDGKEIFLQHKYDVEKSIRSMEEDPSADLQYEVLGSVKTDYSKIPFLISYKVDNSTQYDIIYAKVGVEAHATLLGKNRLKDKEVKITNTLDLRKLIDEYYQ